MRKGQSEGADKHYYQYLPVGRTTQILRSACESLTAKATAKKAP